MNNMDNSYFYELSAVAAWCCYLLSLHPIAPFLLLLFSRSQQSANAAAENFLRPRGSQDIFTLEFHVDSHVLGTSMLFGGNDFRMFLRGVCGIPERCRGEDLQGTKRLPTILNCCQAPCFPKAFTTTSPRIFHKFLWEMAELVPIKRHAPAEVMRISKDTQAK